jgi:hypothetical protein
MATEPCDERREAIGALVIGELDAIDEAGLRAHARECEGCRREIESLEPVGVLLQRADPDRVGVETTPPLGLAQRLAQRLGAERRRRRRRRAGLALAAAAATCAAAIAIVIPGGDEPPSRMVAFDTGDPRIALTASLAPQPWGTEVTVAVRGIEEGTRCRVVLISGDRRREPAGSFVYRYGQGSDAAELTSAVPADSVNAVEVRAGDRVFQAPAS